METPLDKVEPYGMFKHALFRKFFVWKVARAYTDSA